MTGETSGTTVTFVVIDGWTVTVASVGDSRCILDTQGGIVSLLTVDHRLEENVEERERVTASGGEVGRLNVFGGSEVCNFFCKNCFPCDFASRACFLTHRPVMVCSFQFGRLLKLAVFVAFFDPIGLCS